MIGADSTIFSPNVSIIVGRISWTQKAPGLFGMPVERNGSAGQPLYRRFHLPRAFKPQWSLVYQLAGEQAPSVISRGSRNICCRFLILSAC